jgi:hypothetical protein
VADGLSAAHARAVVHRDLKPDNVLVDRDLDGTPRVRLTDFGIARVLDAPGITTPGAVVGTPNYMAPELIEGGRPTPAVDVYALGMMFYELVVGRPPYADHLQSTILMRHLGAAPRRRAGIPKAAWTLIQACIGRDPGRRPSASALVVALRRVSRQTAGVPALPVLADDQGRQPIRPRRAALSTALVAIALTLSVGAGAAGKYLLGGDSRAEAGRAAAGAAAMATTPSERRPGTAAKPGKPPSGTPEAPPPVSAGSGPAGTLSPTRPGGLPEAAAPAGSSKGGTVQVPLPAAFGPWHCSDKYEWSVGHPALARPCYATGPSVRVMGSMKGAPGVRVDLSVAVHDADTDEEVKAPHTCAGLEFSDVTPERTCGPFDLTPDRGHRYLVVVSWKYTDMVTVPGGVVRGDVLTW